MTSATTSQFTSDDYTGLLAGVSDTTIVIGLVVGAVLLALRGRVNLKASTKAGKTNGVIMMAMVGLFLFGIGWEVAECAMGTEFGSTGKRDPFGQFCPVDKANGYEASSR